MEKQKILGEGNLRKSGGTSLSISLSACSAISLNLCLYRLSSRYFLLLVPEGLQLPDVLDDIIHRSAVGELLLKLHGLACLLDAHEDMEDCLEEYSGEGVIWRME